MPNGKRPREDGNTVTFDKHSLQSILPNTLLYWSKIQNNA